MFPFQKETEYLHKLSPAYRIKEGESLSLWQEKGRKKLYELLGMGLFENCDPDILTEYDVSHPHYREIRFTLQTEPGLRVPCHLLIPHNTEEFAPLMICLQGHSAGMHISLGKAKFEGDEKTIAGDRDFALQSVEQGFASLVLEQRGFGELGGTPETHCQEPSMAALLSGRTMLGARVWDISRILDGVTDSFGNLFDKDRIYCMGNSGGGTATFYAAALDERIKGAIPSCSFCTFKDSIGAIRHCTCNFVPHMAQYFDMADLAGLIAPRPLVIVSGKDDNIFPIANAKEEFNILEKLYYNISENPNGCCHFIGSEGHRFYRGAWDVFKKMI